MSEPKSKTTAKDPLLARLELRAQYPDNGRVDGISAAEDWWTAKMEIERLRAALSHVSTVLRDRPNIWPTWDGKTGRIVREAMQNART